MVCQQCGTCQLQTNITACPMVRDEIDDRFRSGVLKLLTDCNGNPLTIVIALARSAGLTEREAGQIIGCTAKTVCNHIRYVGRRNPELAKQLRRRWALVEAMSTPPVKVLSPDAMRRPSPGDVTKKK